MTEAHFRGLLIAGFAAVMTVGLYHRLRSNASREKLEKVVEVSVHARGEQYLHAVGGGPTWQFASTMAAERLDQQASKLKGKWKDRRRR